MSDLGLILSDDPNDRRPTLRMGIVMQSNPLLVRIGNQTATPATKLASYAAPAMGHHVVVLILPGIRLVLGNVS